MDRDNREGVVSGDAALAATTPSLRGLTCHHLEHTTPHPHNGFLLVSSPLLSCSSPLPIVFLSFFFTAMTAGGSPSSRLSSSPLHHLTSIQKPLLSLSPLRLYLIAFNLLSFLGWLYISLLTLHHLLTSPSPLTTLHQSIFSPLLLVQTFATLEVVHSLVGVTRSPFLISFFQLFQRNFVLWGVCYPVPSVREQWGFAVMVVAWCVVEVVRHPFYVLIVSSTPPYPTLPRWLIWWRYSLFLPLYPLGVVGELSCLLRAIPVLFREDIWTLDMPNALNFSFDWAYYCVFDALLYLPGCPWMYSHMRQQRRTILMGIDASDKLKGN